MKEEADVKRREKNVVVYNLKESEDQENFEDLTNVLSDLQLSESIERNQKKEIAIFRLGKTVIPGKPRPILIKFKETEGKLSLLNGWRELKEKNLWAQRDMTVKGAI